ncbi:MAG: hypothetical protein ACE5H9_13705 [Anaerolineae bacterium]
MLPVSAASNAWREILYRVFKGFEQQENVSPRWLVNPDTHRPLKLDFLWPQIGVAARLHGLQGKQRRRRSSLEEEDQQRNRDVARAALCEAHGITLVPIPVAEGEPKAVFRELEMALSRAARRLAHNDELASSDKTLLVERVSQARSQLADIARRVRTYDQLSLYADLWLDRQYAVPEAEPSASNGPLPTYRPGMEVEHTAFGPGVVLGVTDEGDETLVTVDFVTAGQRTFAASLVGDKLLPRRVD